MTQLDRVDNTLCATGRHVFTGQRGRNPGCVGWWAVLRAGVWGLGTIAIACAITSFTHGPMVAGAVLGVVVAAMAVCFAWNLLRGHRGGCAAKRSVRAVLCAYEGASPP
ncbi:hypothetical protein B4N89_42375 [Embleya scabrispora]|uniref:Uncharacterized protein n=1 Tax=Embleya scabrispora TaxID=159449 RepID=A0A1T3NK18_9ACTN|nr:hypothetical protein [Embleya scabrispora]OPC77196.1 hypothetical protein B4N89_42375 [Embleya scabrispora]